jgi:hypothetical protein
MSSSTSTPMPEPHSSQSGSSCGCDPVQHNLVLTLLDARAEHAGPGRFAWVLDRDEVVGVGFQSPLVLQAVVTAMPASVVEAFVDRLADAWPDIPVWSAPPTPCRGSPGAGPRCCRFR